MTARIVLGTAGHIDHGKTSLVKALTGTDTDRLKEEKRRGITIELGFARLELTDKLSLGVVDVPGHERFVRTMVAGAAGIDLVVMIIAADEGIMPQTREHIDICQLLGVQTGLVALTKTDLVDEEWLAMVREDAADYLADTFLADAPIIPCSASTGQGLDDLRRELVKICNQVSERKESGPYRLGVDRVFTMHGFGTVVTGTSLSGRIEVGQPVIVYPEGLESKIRGLQVHGKEVPAALAGQRTAINLQGVGRTELHRGQWIASAGSMQPSKRLDAEFKLLSSAPRPLKNRTEASFHVGATEARIRVILLEEDQLKPGEESLVQLVAEEDVACLPGDHYVIRSYSPAMTIGGGKILSIRPPRRKRFDEAEIKALKNLGQAPAEERISLLVRESRLLGLSKTELYAAGNLTAKRLDSLLQELMSQGELIRYDKEGFRLVHRDSLTPLDRAVEKFLTDYHRAHPLKSGAPREELKSRLKLHADPKLVSFQVGRLIETGRLKGEEEWIALADHQVALNQDLGVVQERILQAYKAGGLQPPRFKDLAAELKTAQTRDVLEVLLKAGKLVKVKDDLFFDPPSLDGLRAKLEDFFNHTEELTTQDFKELAGVSRKFLIPLAEYFDRTGVTIRVGEIRKKRIRLKAT